MKQKLTTLFFLISFSLSAQINNIETFLNTCPLDDNATSQILNDFEFRIDGQKVDPFCENSRLESILQALRFINYQNVEIPWSNSKMYDWVVDNVHGIDLVTNLGTEGKCCYNESSNKFMSIINSDNPRTTLVEKYKEINGLVSTILHEARHAEGIGHDVSCCPTVISCDQTYDNTYNAYTISIWVQEQILYGGMKVGIWELGLHPFDMLPFAFVNSGLINTYANQFCDNNVEFIIIRPQEMDMYFGGQTTNVFEIEETKNTLYPNPLKLGNELNVTNYRAFNLNGQQVSEFEKGVYFVMFDRKIEKLIVN